MSRVAAHTRQDYDPPMPSRMSLAIASAVIVLAGVGLRGADAAYEKKVNDWRAKHEADYRRDYVPLAGLFNLKNGVNTVGSAPGSDIKLPARVPASIGRLIYDGKQVRFEPAPNGRVTLRGKPVTAAMTLADDSGTADELQIGDVAFWVHMSGVRHTIRLRDPQSDPAKSFTGFTWFPIDEKYRVTARFIKDPKPQQIRMASLSGDDQLYMSEGMVEFTLEGQRIRMRPMTTRPNRFFFVFRDLTSGTETYEAARFLYADLNPDGTTVLDFNEAYNPPCAFNPFTTCPLPLPENRLKIRIPAGERNYSGPKP